MIRPALLSISLSFLFIAFQVPAQTMDSHFRRHIDTLASERFEGRRAGTRGDTLAARYIAKELSKIEQIELLGNNGLQEVSYTGTRPPETDAEIHTFNVTAVIKAPRKNNPGNSSLIIGAHYDHEGVKPYDGHPMLHPGADDNASGIAFLIELARELGKRQSELRHDIVIIAFGAEEQGTKGSSYYAAHPVWPLDNAKAMINFDMLGRMRNGGLTIRGLSTAEEATSMFAALPNPDELELIWEMRGNGPTDYASFYKAGIPAFSFSTRTHNDYHSPKDTPDKINYEGMEKARRYIMPLIEQLAFRKIKLTYRKPQ